MPAIPNAKYPTGIVIDLKSPQGNVFYLIGLAHNRLIRELGLSAEEIVEIKQEQASATTYQATKMIAQCKRALKHKYDLLDIMFCSWKIV